MSDEVIAANLIALWLGFSLTFVLLVGLWLFIHFDTSGAVGPNKPSRWQRFLLRALLFGLIGAGVIGGALGNRGEWTALSLWVGIAIAFWAVITSFGDLRRWGKTK